MAGYRFDELTREWVVIAPARRGIPIDPTLARAPNAVPSNANCPFCPGHESETEETIAARNDEAGRWLVRVVGNRFPSVMRDARIEAAATGGDERPATGAHEVIVEAREHDLDLATLDEAQAVRVLEVFRDRYAALEGDPKFAAVSLFRNRGVRSGSSQSHPHSQIVATSVLPPAFELRHRIAREYAVAHDDASLLDDLASRERDAGARIVTSTEALDVYCPFASHRSYETWIVPRTRRASISQCDDAELAVLATTLVHTIAAVMRATRDAAYNVLVRHPPARSREPWARWHIEIVPRTGGDAGFELLSGMEVVPVAPEAAAAAIRAFVTAGDGAA